MKQYIYKVEGMHCASCEILVEKKLLDVLGVKSVDASTGKGEVVIESEGDKLDVHKLNSLFKEENYRFSDFITPKQGIAKAGGDVKKSGTTLVAFNIAIFIIIAFLILDKIGIANFLSLSSKSSLFTFLGFGILAGFSSCTALVGGIVLSMSKQWQGLYSENETASKKVQPHIMFNSGRVMSYVILGGILGLIGSRLEISAKFTGFLVVFISLLMIALGLQMLGVKAFRKFQLAMPKFATRFVANENNFQSKYAPFIMGALTFFLPCGFTITAQSLALISGSFVNGAIIMGAFVLGTVPALLLIGLSSVKFYSKPGTAEKFSKVAGFLVLFFAIYNISNQVNVLGLNFNQPPASAQSSGVATQDGLAPVVGGKQIIKMTASGRGDSPNYFKVKAGVPVSWEITAGSSLGCNNGLISQLFEGQIYLTPGQVTVKEFTPQKAGVYQFSCSMGMIRGTIEVIN